ncbi:MAG: hypothetical protein K0R51_129 [Cytophagaceae bacterium]|jgi:hypothetical protein|nr:hypothetical protein [Cytophagaceae bacterium]
MAQSLTRRRCETTPWLIPWQAIASIPNGLSNLPSTCRGIGGGAHLATATNNLLLNTQTVAVFALGIERKARSVWAFARETDLEREPDPAIDVLFSSMLLVRGNDHICSES